MIIVNVLLIIVSILLVAVVLVMQNIPRIKGLKQISKNMVERILDLQKK